MEIMASHPPLKISRYATATRISYQIKSKSNLHYTRRITPKRVTSCGAHLRGLAPGLHSSE